MRYKDKRLIRLSSSIITLTICFGGVFISTVNAITINNTKSLSLKKSKGYIDIIRPIEKETYTGENTITFMGMSNYKNKTTLNGTTIDTFKDGNFVLEVPLEEGVNKFEFVNGKEKVEYVVNKEVRIIDSISPSEEMIVDENSEVEILTKLYNGSKAYAIINNERIDLIQEESLKFINSRNTYYAKFKGKYYPKAKDNLEKVKVVACYKGIEEVKEGGIIKVNPPCSKFKYGSINKDSAKVYNSKNLSAIPLMDKWPLPKGTNVIIKSKVKNDNKEYYVLENNRRVKSEDIDIFNCSKDPTNNISNIEVTQDEDKTKLIIETSRKLPFNLELLNIDYKDKEKENYAVNLFNPREVHITFDYLESIYDTIKFNKNNMFDSILIDNTTLKLKLNDKAKFLGAFTYYDENNKLNIDFINKKKSIYDMTIVIDPGHGKVENGFDVGALGFNSINENEININMSKKLEKELLKIGAKVIRLDTENKLIPLRERGFEGRKNNADLYISIHNNSGGSGKLNATETYYYTPYSKEYAENINNYLVKCYEEDLYKRKDESYNRGDKFNDFIVILERENPSVLVEVGYLDNPISFSKLIDKKNQEKIVKSIIKGIENTIK